MIIIMKSLNLNGNLNQATEATFKLLMMVMMMMMTMIVMLMMMMSLTIIYRFPCTGTRGRCCPRHHPSRWSHSPTIIKAAKNMPFSQAFTFSWFTHFCSQKLGQESMSSSASSLWWSGPEPLRVQRCKPQWRQLGQRQWSGNLSYFATLVKLIICR